MLNRYSKIDSAIEDLKSKTLVIDDKISNILSNNTKLNLKGRVNAGKILKRPEIKLPNILEALNETIDKDIIDIVEMEIKYEGYIKRDLEKIAKMNKMENLVIPSSLKYEGINGIKVEAQEKLNRIKPTTIGQAMRISGIDPTVISILIIHIESINRTIKSNKAQ
jgi:tRNA uridine 5-carboxymethylaminomethyl modification enzyme